MEASPDKCANIILDVVPLIMRAMRAEVRSHRASNLTVPQHRTLVFLNTHAGASLSEMAEHLGLTPPSTSKLVDGLVVRQLVMRRSCLEDRRRITLTLTENGKSVLEGSFRATRARFAERLAILSEADRAIVVQAMQALRPIFATSGEQVLNMPLERS